MLLAEITWTFPWFIRIQIFFFQSHHADNTINTVSFLKAWNWCVLWKKGSTIYNSGYELRLSLEIELGSSFCCLPFTYPVTLGNCLIPLRFNFLIYKQCNYNIFHVALFQELNKMMHACFHHYYKYYYTIQSPFIFHTSVVEVKFS